MVVVRTGMMEEAGWLAGGCGCVGERNSGSGLKKNDGCGGGERCGYEGREENEVGGGGGMEERARCMVAVVVVVVEVTVIVVVVG